MGNLRRILRHLLDLAARMTRAPYADGHPELSLFPSVEERKRAVEAIERGMTPRTWRACLGFAWAVILFLSIPMGVGWLVSLVLLPSLGAWAGRIALMIGLGGYVLIVYVMIRREMPKALRLQLLEAGVPVCLKCGYDLKAQFSSGRCPECGKELSPRVAEILAAREQELSKKALEVKKPLL